MSDFVQYCINKGFKCHKYTKHDGWVECEYTPGMFSTMDCMSIQLTKNGNVIQYGLYDILKNNKSYLHPPGLIWPKLFPTSQQVDELFINKSNEDILELIYTYYKNI